MKRHLLNAVNVKFRHADWLRVNAVAANERPRYQSESGLPGLNRPALATSHYLSGTRRRYRADGNHLTHRRQRKDEMWADNARFFWG